MQENGDRKNQGMVSNPGPGYDSEMIQKYIEKLLGFENRPHAVTGDDLEKIARELGLSDKDLSAIKQEALKHAKKGKGFLKHQCFDQAVDEYGQAYACSPLDADILEGLARAYLERFFENRENSDLESAVKYATRGIELFPDKSSFYEIIKKTDIRKTVKHPGNSKTAVTPLTMVFAVLLVAAVSILAFTYFSRKKESTIPVAETNKTEDTGDKTYIEEPGELSIPVVFEPDNDMKNISFVTDSSLYKKYDESFSYTLKAEMFFSGYEVQRLTVKISTMDSSGKVINTRFSEAIGESDESVFPGDSVPIGELIYEKGTPPDIRKVQAGIYFIKAVPASGNYALRDKLPVKWETNRDVNQDIEVYKRSSDYTPGTGTRYHFLVLRVKNSGSRPVTRLRLGAVWYDRAGKKIVSNYTYVVADSQPQLNTNVIRSCRIIGSFTKDMPDFDRYEISVLDMK